MKLRNLKASFILKEKVSLPIKVRNFTFRQDEFTFNIYIHYPTLVNVTGVKCFERLQLAKTIVEEKLQQQVIKVRIDNTFYSQKNYRNVDLNRVFDYMKENEKFHVDYNIELFAGMYFHPKMKNYPTILFFRTGSYTMMGGKEIKLLEECESFVKMLIQIFDK